MILASARSDAALYPKTAQQPRKAIIGNTFPVRNQLKSLGDRWSADRKAGNVPAEKAEQAKAPVADAPTCQSLMQDKGVPELAQLLRDKGDNGFWASLGLPTMQTALRQWPTLNDKAFERVTGSWSGTLTMTKLLPTPSAIHELIRATDYCQ